MGGFGQELEAGKNQRGPRTGYAWMVADDAEHLLKMGRIGCAYPEDAVSLAGHCVRLDDLWDAADHLPHPFGWHPAFAVDLDEGLNRPAQRSRLDFGCEAPDDTAITKAIDPPFGGCGGESDVMSEHGKALPAMVGQPRKDLVINFIKTQYSFLTFIDHTIGLACSRTLLFKGDNHSAEATRAPHQTCEASALPDVPADIFRCGLFH